MKYNEIPYADGFRFQVFFSRRAHLGRVGAHDNPLGWEVCHPDVGLDYKATGRFFGSCMVRFRAVGLTVWIRVKMR